MNLFKWNPNAKTAVQLQSSLSYGRRVKAENSHHNFLKRCCDKSWIISQTTGSPNTDCLKRILLLGLTVQHKDILGCDFRNTDDKGVDQQKNRFSKQRGKISKISSVNMLWRDCSVKKALWGSGCGNLESEKTAGGAEPTGERERESEPCVASGTWQVVSLRVLMNKPAAASLLSLWNLKLTEQSWEDRPAIAADQKTRRCSRVNAAFQLFYFYCMSSGELLDIAASTALHQNLNRANLYRDLVSYFCLLLTYIIFFCQVFKQNVTPTSCRVIILDECVKKNPWKKEEWLRQGHKRKCLSQRRGGCCHTHIYKGRLSAFDALLKIPCLIWVHVGTWVEWAE